MLKDMKIRTFVLAVHGTLAVVLGAAFLYLGATMTNLVFDAIAVAIAILLATAALILAGVTDLVAACSEGTKRLQSLLFYLVAGVALASGGAVLGYSPQATMQWLLVVAAIHALAFSVFAFASAAKAPRRMLQRRSAYSLATLSALFSGAMASVATLFVGDAAATALLGIYLFFVGAKMLFFAWNLDHAVLEEEKPPVPKVLRPSSPQPGLAG